MGTAFDYRQRAEDQRRAANATPLLMVRLKHLSAAEKWDALAEEIERHEASQPRERAQDVYF